MTKFKWVFCFALVFCSYFRNGYSAEEPSIYREIKENKKKGPDGSEETLQKLLTISGVKEQYLQCQNALKNSLSEIPKCIWEGNPDNKIPPLSTDLKKQVQQMYATEIKPTTPIPDGGADSSNLTNKSKQIVDNYMSDPAVVELSNIFQKKLEESLYGDAEAKKDTSKKIVVDHAKFIKIYQTELGKTIVSAFTSYCIEADIPVSQNLFVKTCKNTENPTGSCPLSVLGTSAKDTIKINIDSLKGAKLSSNTDKETNPDSAKWTRCIASVSNVCYTAEDNFASASSSKEDRPSSDQITRSKNKACVIMDYVKSARKNLIIADGQKKYYEELGSGISIPMENVQEVTVTAKNSIDAVTSVTSKDIDDAYKSKTEDLKKEMDKCIDKDRKIIDTESCKKFISTDTEAKEKELTEFGIRQYALGDKIDETLKDKSEVQKYLKEEGYTATKISTIISSDTELATIKKEISARYKNERDSLISFMADKIKSKTSSSNGKIEGSEDEVKLGKIREELSSRPEDIKQLVHFNNIVASYLEIDKKDGQKGRNVAGLFAEINDGAKMAEKDKMTDLENIAKNANQAGLVQEQGENPVELGVDNLNGIFKYSTEK